MGLYVAVLDDYLEDGGTHTFGQIGKAKSYLLPVEELVEYGMPWMDRTDFSGRESE